MPAHAAEGPRRRATSITLTSQDEDLLEALAQALGVSRSVAISHLISVHAGLEVERAQQANEPYPVVRWAQPKIGPELIGYIAGLVRAGNLPDVAASMAGVTSRQLADWRRRGRRDLTNDTQSVYADFVANLDAAEAEVQAEDIRRIRNAGGSDWRALAWALSRMHPDRYGERKRVDRTSQVNVMPVIDWDRLTIPETRTLVELLRKASPELDDPRVTKQARPALELLPPDVLEQVAEAPAIGETIDGEATEAPALETESPGPREAPALGEDGAGGPASPNTRSGNARSHEQAFGEQAFGGTSVRVGADPPADGAVDRARSSGDGADVDPRDARADGFDSAG